MDVRFSDGRYDFGVRLVDDHFSDDNASLYDDGENVLTVIAARRRPRTRLEEVGDVRKLLAHRNDVIETPTCLFPLWQMRPLFSTVDDRLEFFRRARFLSGKVAARKCVVRRSEEDRILALVSLVPSMMLVTDQMRLLLTLGILLEASRHETFSDTFERWRPCVHGRRRVCLYDPQLDVLHFGDGRSIEGSDGADAVYWTRTGAVRSDGRRSIEAEVREASTRETSVAMPLEIPPFVEFRSCGKVDPEAHLVRVSPTREMPSDLIAASDVAYFDVFSYGDVCRAASPARTDSITSTNL